MGALPQEATRYPWEGKKCSFSPPPEGLEWHKNGFANIGGSGIKIVRVRDV